MEKKDHEFLKRLRATFKVEADEHVRALSSGLLKLEKASAAEKQRAIVETMFREAHSLKGAARAVNMPEIEKICHSLETLFSALKRQDQTLSGALIDGLGKAIDTLGHLVVMAEDEGTVTQKPWITETTRDLERAHKATLLSSTHDASGDTMEDGFGVQPKALPPSQGVVTPPTLGKGNLLPADTVRISTARLNALLLQVEELLSAKLASGQRLAELREAGAALGVWEKQRAKIQSELRLLQQSLEGGGKPNGRAARPEGTVKTNRATGRVLEFVEQTDSVVKSLQTKLATTTRLAGQDCRSLAGMVDNLLVDMKKALILPFSSMLEGFPKLVRDLSRDCGKDVALLVQGGGIELDRRILEELKDPLLHMVRNCIDHGIEAPEERERKKKARRGTIAIIVTQKDGDRVEILVSDDGAGINPSRVRAAVLKLGILTEEEAQKMSDQAMLSLVFQSGVSTSPIVTDISGRGLGLAILQEKVERLAGTVSLETQADVGTKFRIVLPLTLATFRGVLVRVDENF
jgi:two-component system, chemotaxis family, sensor kinase CheA